jgi:hypothetical protein
MSMLKLKHGLSAVNPQPEATMYHSKYNWEEQKNKPIGVIGCLAWLSCLALWAVILYAVCCLAY